MKMTIDNKVCLKHGLTTKEVFLLLTLKTGNYMAHPIKSVARLTKYQRYAVEKERYVPYTTQLTSECLQFGVK